MKRQILFHLFLLCCVFLLVLGGGGIFSSCNGDPGQERKERPDGSSHLEKQAEGGPESTEERILDAAEATPEAAPEAGAEETPPEPRPEPISETLIDYGAAPDYPKISSPKIVEIGKGKASVRIQPGVALGEDGKIAVVWTGSAPGQCVECLESRDCQEPGKVCDTAHRCVTPLSCAKDTDCKAPTPKCHPTYQKCVECLGDGDCKGANKMVCQTHVCVDTTRECQSDKDCQDAKKPNCDPSRGRCVLACTSDAPCKGTSLPRCQKGGNLAIYFTLLAQDGTEEVSALRLDTTPGNKVEPTICARKGGGYVLVWPMDNQRGHPNMEIRLRRIDGKGQPLEDKDQPIDTGVKGNHNYPALACTDDGGFVVAGSNLDTDQKSFAVFLWRFGADGKAQGKAVRANVEEEGNQVYASPGVASQKKVVVAWSHRPSTPQKRVRFRLFSPDLSAPSRVFPVWGTAVWGRVSVHREKGVFALGAILDEGQRIALRSYQPDGSDPRHLPLGDSRRGGYSSFALAPLERPGDHAIVYARRSSSAVSIVAKIVGPPDVAQPPFVVASGSTTSLPLYYKPSLAYHNKRLVVAWTERLAIKTNFAIKLALFE